ncbi:MAG: hypothetical protein WAZ40_02145 [Minisyncoccia bacterium]
MKNKKIILALVSLIPVVVFYTFVFDKKDSSKDNIIFRVENGQEIKIQGTPESIVEEKRNLQLQLQGIVAKGDESACDTFSIDLRYQAVCHNLFINKK